MRVHVLHRLQIVRRDLREGSIMLFGIWKKAVGFIYDFDEALFAHQFGAVLALVPLLASLGLAASSSRIRASSSAVQAVLPCTLLTSSSGGGAGVRGGGFGLQPCRRRGSQEVLCKDLYAPCRRVARWPHVLC